jgi:hypothetical protein
MLVPPVSYERTNRYLLVLNLPVFAGVGISRDSSSALVRITSRVIGKPSLRFSRTYWIARCSRSWKRPVLVPLNGFQDEFAFLSFPFIYRHPRTLASVTSNFRPAAQLFVTSAWLITIILNLRRTFSSSPMQFGNPALLLLRKHKANVTSNRASGAQKQTLLRVLYNVKTFMQWIFYLIRTFKTTPFSNAKTGKKKKKNSSYIWVNTVLWASQVNTFSKYYITYYDFHKLQVTGMIFLKLHVILNWSFKTFMVNLKTLSWRDLQWKCIIKTQPAVSDTGEAIYKIILFGNFTVPWH